MARSALRCWCALRRSGLRRAGPRGAARPPHPLPARSELHAGRETFPGVSRPTQALAALLCCLLPLGAPAADAALSLQEALGLASAAHPSVRARISDRVGARARLDAARWQRYPQVALQASAGTAGTQESALVVQVPLWEAGRIDAEVDAASRRVDASSEAVAGAQLAIMETVVSVFGDLSRLRDRAAAAAVNVGQHERLVALMERRVAAEISSPADLTLARGRLAQAQGELRQIEAQAATSRSALEQAIGRVVTQVSALVARDLQFADASVAVQAAQEASPELRRLLREVEAARSEVLARRAARYPQIVARYRHDIRSGGLGGGVHQALLGLEYQSGPGLSAEAAVREAEARVESLRLERIPLIADTHSRLIADSVPGDRGHPGWSA